MTAECEKHKLPLKDGDAVLTSACKIKNAKAIIHAVGPDFGSTPKAFKELYDAYYNSLKVLMDNGYHSISFPLISSGIFGGALEHPVAESTKQCCRAFRKFTGEYPDYNIDVRLCVFSSDQMSEAKTEFDKYSF
ncbi:MAG: macro domain-containing protein [Clostridiales bacterium]|nr:macro domain-containing protein [Clostridiales bacterium]